MSTEMMGGSGNKWQVSADWLKGLKVEQVVEWFDAQRNSTRLGDQFALCVEYILRFSPVIQTKRLLVSQQVLQRVVWDSPSLKFPQRVGEAPIINAQDLAGKRGHTLNVMVESSGKGVVIKYLNCSFFNQPEGSEAVSGGRTKQALSVSCNLEDETLLSSGSVPVRKELPQESEEVMPENNAINDNDAFFEGSKGQGKRKKKLLRKLERLRNGMGITHTLGEFDFLFQAEGVVDQTKHFEDRTGLQCMVNASKTINADYDFVQSFLIDLTCSQLQAHENTSAEEIKVHHWEVSVKFLLYAGPWEVFGLMTPSHATWKTRQRQCNSGNRGINIDSFDVHGLPGACHNTPKEPLAKENYGSVVKDVWQMYEYLGCFLGPHVGETLFNRKTRLSNQLMLSHNAHAAAFVHQLFTGVDNSGTIPAHSVEGDKYSHVNEYKRNSHNADLDITRSEILEDAEPQDAKSVRLYPRALLKGYLFYEHDLWCSLIVQRNAESCSSTAFEIGNVGGKCLCEVCAEGHLEYTGDLPSQLDTEMQMKFTGVPQSKLNVAHWMGWWIHIGDFSKFACSYHHQSSMWYIVPKKEWLSPVIINKADKDRCSRVVNVDDFLRIAAMVAEEAEKTKIPRRRRFMVAEMCLGTDSCNDSSRKHDENPVNLRKGVWMEVSRGFVVEDTWPDSRLYSPHGYVMSWSPSLQRGI